MYAYINTPSLEREKVFLANRMFRFLSKTLVKFKKFIHACSVATSMMINYSGDNFVPLSKDNTYAFGSGQLGQLKVP